MSFKRNLFDIETDGLLDECTRVWILCITDLNSGKKLKFLEGDLGWMEVFDNSEKLVGHYILGFDLPALKKIHNYTLPSHVHVTDTLVLSQVLNYRRFGDDGHSLERWGQFFGQPKQVHEDWSQFSPEMETRCESDVELNIRVYRKLIEEIQRLSPKAPRLITYLDVEHSLMRWCAEAERIGWPFDETKAASLKEALDASMKLAYDALSEKLGTKTVPVDKVKGIVETKRPKWIKNGFYDSHTCRWFGIEPPSGFEGEERLVEGEYCRVQFEKLSLDSVSDVKIFLFRHGWEPTEWNYKTDEETGKKVQTSPKITEDSLEFLGGDGKLYADFAVARSRVGILNTWMSNVKEGRLHGSCITIGTPSMRARHQIIVNVPSVDSPWGKEMRELFTCPPGWKLVGCDSSGNQARGLAHYLGDPVFIDTLLNGDIHQFNADTLTDILRKMGIDFVVKRSQAKRILYAFLFGASGAKLWSYIFGKHNAQKGNILKNEFIKAVPGFKVLLDKLAKIFKSTEKFGDGYIPSIAGIRVYVDSFHKLLVYLLQSAEKATCGAAVMLLMRFLEAERIPYQPYIFMHDEVQFAVPEQFAFTAGELGKRAFKEGPKLMGIDIMDGDYRVGNNWYDTH
jgi:DNA polymerase-1